MWTNEDNQYMQLAINLARKGLGRTWPNPMVGAVIMKNNKVIAQGWHKQYGKPHAEIMALKKAGGLSKGATLYVNLEPCSHFGATPPCADAIIKAGIKKVIAAMRDPNPKVSGNGFKKLRNAGIEVQVGLLKKEAQSLNKVFLKQIKTGLPYINSKAAITLDGKIADKNRQSKWITSEAARNMTHEMRLISQAVIVGSGTAIEDDPLLTVRHKKVKDLRQPIRIVIEGNRSISITSKLVMSSKKVPLIIVTPRKKKDHPLMSQKHIQIWSCPKSKNRVDIKCLLHRLSEQGISMVMIEGGSDIHAAFLGMDSEQPINFVDEINWFIAPKIMGGKQAVSVVGGKGVKPQAAINIDIDSIKPIGNDWLIQGKVRR